MVRRWVHAALASALLTGLGAGRAQAYVRSTTDAGAPFHWNETCVPITIYLNDFTTTPAASGMTPTDAIKSVTAAAHTWSTDAVTCPGSVATSPSLEIVPSVAPDAAAPPKVAWDAKNSIIFRTDLWTKSGETDTIQYAYEALAVTTVTARGDGHIVDADMEINAVNKVWMNLDPGIYPPSDHGLGSDVYDLQNALTHEFGHFVGLAHTCFVPSLSNPLVDDNDQIRPMDDQGKPIPDCDSAPSAVINTVMFASTDPESTSKRTLSPDDIAGVCGIYPQGRDAPACALDEATPGCAVAPPRSSRRGDLGRGLSLAAVGVLVAAVGARRRARRG